MDSDSEFGDIDFESTEVSDQDADKEYDVERILASKQINGEERFLVLWKGYPIERSTWEPERSFTDPNTILDWRKTAIRQKKGLEPEFDWQQWDKDQQEDELKRVERRRKREIKRRRVGWSRRAAYDSGSELEGFVVADDEVSTEGETDQSSESEPDLPGRVRKRKKGSTSIESDDASDDSLLEAARKKQLRLRKRLKSRQKSGHASQEESSPTSPRTRSTVKKEDRVKLEKRKRDGSPSDILSGAAKNLSLDAKQVKKQHNGPDRQPKKQKLQGPIRIVAKPLRPGPSRFKQRRVSDNAPAPGQVKTFTSLSHVNRINKAGKNEPPPDPSQLELFAPGQPGRVLPPLMPLPRRASTSLTNAALTGSSTERPPSPVKLNKSIPYASFKIPKRKPSTSAQGAPQTIPATTYHDDNQSYFGSEIVTRRDSNTVREVPRNNRGPLVHQDAMDLDNGIDGLPQTMSPKHLMEVDNVKPLDPRVFVCNLEQGPYATLVGEARFIGFPTSFVEELYNKPQCRALWISKFYGQKFIKENFAPHYGTPLYNAAVEIDPDQVQPLINALAFLKGAGVVLHADFTMLVYLPSNQDLDKQTFKLPQLPAAGPNKIKPALRVVVYPSLEGIPIPLRDSNTEAHSRDIARAADALPWWERNLQFSVPAYLADTVDCNWDEVLEMERESIDKAKGREIKETIYVLLYPPIAEAESKEYKHALECLNKKVVDLKYLRNHVQQGHQLQSFTFLIHQSLRRQLHLLPDLVRDRKKEARSYWLYGTKFDIQRIEEKPEKIWASGTIIFITPELIVSCPEAYRVFLSYAERKAATTKLALPSIWEEKVMEFMQKEPDQAVLNHVFEIKEKIRHNSIILIPVDLHPDCNELDAYIDEFALYQLDNPYQFRRHWFGHLTLPDPGILALFRSIEFYTYDLLDTNEELRRFFREKDLQPRKASNAATMRKDPPQVTERRA